MYRLLLASILFFSAQTSLAQVESVPEMYKLVASEQRIPAKLFYAIILNESRSVSKQQNRQRVLPWPWTINHRGESHFFQTKREAYDFVSTLIARSDFRFDIGLGQLNWYWHKDKFKNHWEALDPYVNLSAAAKYLREQFEKPECNTWEKAIGCYHRSGQKIEDKQIAKNYATRVIKLWKEI